MYNPFKEPIPRDPIEQIHAFAKDLAYGAITNRWGAEFLITEDGREERWLNPQNGNILHEVNYKWTMAGKSPSPLEKSSAIMGGPFLKMK